MKTPLGSGPDPSLGAWIEVVKNVVEIGAIIVAGWWTYTQFFRGEAPSLEERHSLDASLKWTSHGPSHCTAILSTTLKNIGKTSFDIDTALVRVWVTPPPPADSTIVRLDPEDLMNRSADDSTMITKGSLIHHYGPDFALSDDFVFLVPLDTTKLAFFRFTAWGHATADRERRVTIDDWRWTGNCEQEYSEVRPEA